MSSDGEIPKNQQSEGDAKANLDTTDSSQDSVAAKSEAEEEKDVKTEDIKEEKDKKDVEKKPEEKPVNDTKQNDSDKKEKNDVEAKNSKEAKEEKTDEDTEGGENEEEEEEDDEDDDKKEVPLLDQPLEQSGTRERKKVQRFNEDLPETNKESTKVEIPAGSGTQLGDIPRIDASISRFKTEDLKLLHRVLFKTPGKTVIIKKNIKKFNGFDFDKDSDAYTKKVQSVAKMELKQLKSICEMLDLEKNGKKEEISDRICEFLLEPKDSGKPVGGGRPKRTAAVRANNRDFYSIISADYASVSDSQSSYSSMDDDDDSDEGSRRASRSKRGKGKRVSLKEESSSESDAEFNPSEESDEETPRVKSKKIGRGRPPAKKQESEEEVSEIEETPSSEESDEPKSKRKRAPVTKVQNNRKRGAAKNAKASPKKSPAKKKAEVKKTTRKRGKEESDEEDEKDNSENNEESSSGDDEPLVKKSKTPQPPTDDEIKTYVKEILEGANLEEITMKTVCKQVYAHYPDFDLAHKKDFIKTTVKSLIST